MIHIINQLKLSRPTNPAFNVLLVESRSSPVNVDLAQIAGRVIFGLGSVSEDQWTLPDGVELEFELFHVFDRHCNKLHQTPSVIIINLLEDDLFLGTQTQTNESQVERDR